VPRIKFNYGWWFYSWSLTVVIQQLSRSQVSGLSKSNNDTTGSRLINNMRLHIYGWPKRTSQTSSGETSHNTSTLKVWISYDNRHFWLTQRSHPWRNHPMLYGCGCGVVDNLNCLRTFVEMRFLWIPL
jgi:hypothetical protein